MKASQHQLGSYMAVFLGCVLMVLGSTMGVLSVSAESMQAKTPLKFSIEPTKRIYTSREGVRVKLVFTAIQRTKLCLKKDVLSQLSVKIHRAGQLVPMQPFTVKDTSLLFKQSPEVHWLDAGETLVRTASLKRYQFKDGSPWFSAEYSVSGAFDLCEQNDRDDVDVLEESFPVKTQQAAWFMIMS